MTQFSVIKNGLVPHDDAARTLLSKHKIGAVIDIELLHPLNVKFNNKMFAAIARIAQAVGVTTDTMKAELLVRTGRFDMVTLSAGRKVPVPHSMSRSAMDQTERELFWDDMREIAANEILPKLNQRDADEIREIFGDQYAGGNDGRSNQTESTGTGNSDAPDGVPETSGARQYEF